MMELKDTIEMMTSEDYKERFIAEYQQTAIRYEKLARMCEKWDNGLLEFNPVCPRAIYQMQLKAMLNYLDLLEARAVMEGIDLPRMILCSIKG